MRAPSATAFQIALHPLDLLHYYYMTISLLCRLEECRWWRGWMLLPLNILVVVKNTLPIAKTLAWLLCVLFRYPCLFCHHHLIIILISLIHLTLSYFSYHKFVILGIFVFWFNTICCSRYRCCCRGSCCPATSLLLLLPPRSLSLSLLNHIVWKW